MPSGVKCLLAPLLALASLSAQAQIPGRIPSLAPGKMLVASPELPDPNFAQTVVVLVHYGGGGAVGLIVNRRSEIAVSRALPDWDLGEHASSFIQLGGPVERRGVMALFRSRTEPKAGLKITGEVYWVTSKRDIQRASSGVMRLYLGHSGWSPGQLEQELKVGAWQVLPADASAIFDANPETLWKRLLERTQMRIASR